MIATAIAMLALLLVAGYALNSGHMLLNKTRLQNIADAAALSAAKVLDSTHDTLLAQQAGFNTLITNLAEAGYKDLAEGINQDSIAFTAEFSDTLNSPFPSGGSDPRFVRISFSANVPLQDLLINMGIQKAVHASAIAGPSPPLSGSACDIAPMMVCGENTLECEGESCTSFYGFAENDYIALSLAAGDTDAEKGNFHLIRLDSPGGAEVRENMAGAYEGCVSTNEQAQTETGVKTGPVVHGLNTRFGINGGGPSMPEYQADFVTDSVEDDGKSFSLNDSGEVVPPEGDIFDYEDYQREYSPAGSGYDTYCPGDGRCHRRMLTIPIVNCSGLQGQSTVDIYGFGCFFLLQPADQQGNERQVYGQFVRGCTNYGSFSKTPTTGPEPTRIFLYKDPDKEDS